MSKNILKIIAFFIVGMVGGIFADQIFWPYFVEKPLFHQYRLEQSPVFVTERKELVIQENTALKEAVEKVEKTVVGIKTQTEEEILEGSGLIVTSDGLIVTLAELVPQGSQFSFFIDGKQPAYQILKRDLKENLALVKVEESNLPTLGFANLDKMKLGERVFLVAAQPQQVRKMVNEGIVKDFSEDLIETNIYESNITKGSPLFNIAGEILGLNTVDFRGRVLTIPITKIKDFIGL